MTTTALELDIDKIKEELLKMGGLVEESVDDAARAMSGRDPALAREVIRKDARINELENVIDAHCIKVIATRQPVAVDLRFLTSSLRLCATLERMGDQAVNLCDRTLALQDLAPMDVLPANLLRMGEVSKEMVRTCLDAYVRQDVDLAYEVCCRDDELDDLNRHVLEEMISWMMDEQRLVRRGVEIILASRNFERVGDLATNVAEEVVFMVEGEVIRHQAGGKDVCNPPNRP